MHGRACFSQHVLARNRSGLSHLSRSGSLAKFTAIRRVRLPSRRRRRVTKFSMVLEIEGSPSAAILMKALWPIGVAFPFVKPDQMPPFRHDVGAEFPAHP